MSFVSTYLTPTKIYNRDLSSVWFRANVKRLSAVESNCYNDRKALLGNRYWDFILFIFFYPNLAAVQCTISNVNINPCAEAAEDFPCKVKRGRSVSLEFDLAPEFPVGSLHSQAYWAQGSLDLPLQNMDTDGCKNTACPIQERTTAQYKWTLNVEKKFPVRGYDVKLKLTSQDPNNFCCFIFKIKLTKWGAQG